MTAKRAIYSITDHVLEDFNRVVPQQERSKLLEGFMRRHVETLEAQLEAAAKAIELDPAYRDLQADVAGMTVETALRLPPFDPS
jgi:hypothetical protein